MFALPVLDFKERFLGVVKGPDGDRGCELVIFQIPVIVFFSPEALSILGKGCRV